MKNRKILYHEVHTLQLNVFILFYVYVFFILFIANLLPVSLASYFLFLAFGIIGICILLVKYRYHISIKENSMLLSLTIPFKVLLLELKVKEIEAVEKITIDPLTYYGYGIIKLKPYYTGYIFTNENGIKLTMDTGQIFVISCTHADHIIARITALKEKVRDEL